MPEINKKTYLLHRLKTIIAYVSVVALLVIVGLKWHDRHITQASAAAPATLQGKNA